MTITESDIRERLRLRYPEDKGWVTAEEVTLASKARRIDLYALNVWQSKRWGVACEIKVNLTDFRRELDQPSKRKPFVDASNEFFYVAPVGVIPPDEIPAECGLIEAMNGDSKQLRIKVRPQQRSIEIPREVLFRLLSKWRDDRHQAAIAQSRDAWCEFNGRKVTLDDIREIGLKYWEHRNYRRIESEARRMAAETSQKRRSNARDWSRIANAINGLARKRGVRISQFDDDEIVRWLTALSGSGSLRLARANIEQALADLDAAISLESPVPDERLEASA